MMFRRIVIGSPGNTLWHLEIFAGLLLVLAGILIAVFPQILVALISALVVLCGIALIGAGWRTRALMRYQRRGEYEVIDS